MGKFLGFLLIMLVGIPVALLRGLVLSDMLEWFTPLRVGVVQAVGIGYIFTFMIAHLSTRFDRKEGQQWWEPPVNSLFSGVFIALIFWAFAYIWHLFL